MLLCTVAHSNAGQEFYIAFSDIGGAMDHRLYIYTSSRYPVRVEISTPLFNQEVFSDYISSSNLTGLVWSMKNPDICMNGTQLEGKGIYITASDSITVYALNVKEKASAGFLALPLEGNVSLTS